MKAGTFYMLPEGAELHLKPDRAAAYGLPDRLVHFERVIDRPGYSVPFIQASGGVFKASDFSKFKL